MGGHHPDGHFTKLRNIRMVKASRGQRSMEASSEGMNLICKYHLATENYYCAKFKIFGTNY